ncbi:MAG: hypothetical protein RLZZ303_1814 [Candidatus Hydrogenedentota bacterium]
MSYPLPKNEQARLEALRRYNILDTKPEQPYENIVRLASKLCGTTIALVSLISSDRQWFKAKFGLDATETPRELAFCTHAILGNETMVVEDATRDPRFCGNPYVQSGLGIRFYAGAPLTDSEGHNLGTLCIIDSVPRMLSPDQQEALESLRQVAVHLIEQRAVNMQLAEALENLKTLHGLLPICSYCKNVRNDEGYWDRIEDYLHQHSDADFTHSICPTCLRENFPDLCG